MSSAKRSPANCQRVCAGKNYGSSRGGLPAASGEGSLAGPLAVSGRQNLTTLSRCEQLYRDGGNPWQMIHTAVRLRVPQAIDTAVGQAAFLRGNFQCGRTKWQV